MTSKCGSVFVLDFDGVIADSMPEQENAWQRALAKVGKSLTSEQRSRILSNFWSGNAGGRIFSGTDLSDDLRLSLRRNKDAFWLERNTSIAPVPGAVQAVQKLSEVSRLCIATTAQRNYVDLNLKRFNIFQFFTCIVTDSDVEKPKPAPDLLLKISQLLSVVPNDLIMIGDTMTDFEMAKAAGSHFVLLSHNKQSTRVDGCLHAYSEWASILNNVDNFCIDFQRKAKARASTTLKS